MNTRMTSKIGNFTINIVSFWDGRLHAYRFRIKETDEVFPTQEKAVKRAKLILKKKREQYCAKYNIVKRVRTKKKVKEKPNECVKKNTWFQINITSECV